jgi:hypothetical protein
MVSRSFDPPKMGNGKVIADQTGAQYRPARVQVLISTERRGRGRLPGVRTRFWTKVPVV